MGQTVVVHLYYSKQRKSGNLEDIACKVLLMQYNWMDISRVKSMPVLGLQPLTIWLEVSSLPVVLTVFSSEYSMKIVKLAQKKVQLKRQPQTNTFCWEREKNQPFLRRLEAAHQSSWCRKIRLVYETAVLRSNLKQEQFR